MRRGVGKTKAIIASYVGIVLFSGLVFLGAWKIAYWQGLLYVVLALVGTTISHILVPANRGFRQWRPRLTIASCNVTLCHR
jgi:hypothetical protein